MCSILIYAKTMGIYVNLSHQVSFMEKPQIKLTGFKSGNPIIR